MLEVGRKKVDFVMLHEIDCFGIEGVEHADTAADTELAGIVAAAGMAGIFADIQPASIVAGIKVSGLDLEDVGTRRLLRAICLLRW
jgi:hypothetical protein